MDKKANFIDIIIYVVIAVILLTVLPILANMSNDGTSSEPISSEPISSEPISSEPISSEPIPSYPTNVVVFKSDSPRTITPKYTNTGITLQYSIDKGLTWNNISSEETSVSSDEIWFRGCATGTKSLYTSNDDTNAWVFSGDASNKLHVYGDLRYLLCGNLGDNIITFNIASYCFSYMFYGCTSLIVAPILHATTLADYCYYAMFYGCTAFKVSMIKSGSYKYEWRIPISGIGTTAESWNVDMLKNTGGPFKNDPTINTIYYLEQQPI